MNSKFFKIVAVLFIIIGIILGIILGFVYGIDISINSAYPKKAFNVGVMFITWAACDFISLMIAWKASVLEKLEKIENKVCNNIAH